VDSHVEVPCVAHIGERRGAARADTSRLPTGIIRSHVVIGQVWPEVFDPVGRVAAEEPEVECVGSLTRDRELSEVSRSVMQIAL